MGTSLVLPRRAASSIVTQNIAPLQGFYAVSRRGRTRSLQVTISLLFVKIFRFMPIKNARTHAPLPRART